MRGTNRFPNRRSTLAVCGMALAALLLTQASPAADGWGKQTRVTFSGSVTLPGVTLPAGAYTFELVPEVNNVVRVMSRNRLRQHYIGFTRPVERPAGMAPTQTVMLGDAPRGVAPPVRAWYPIGSRTGFAFLF